MARQHADERATPALPAPADQRQAQRLSAPVDSSPALSAAAVAVAIGLGVGFLAAWALQAPASREPSLAHLLHGMVGIKALIYSGALVLVGLRLRGPVGARALAGYCLGLGMSAAALVWLWGLSGLLVGSVLFYGGLVVVYLTASRDPLVAVGFRRGPPSRRTGAEGDAGI
ncbi:MAG: hypothetical protein LJE69_10735 [Thiohalocapsa sp.]|jgi:hypothetical protein|uniref:hypothetical protein n=1 Tax=Thiohalocapsa sp. TaxID=2497641 RepID=UPI0025DE3A87|nr:hypothetical protein [Thiohalocapsa sp.]MCG6941712.1 hypothetical protein [Thiohalocapsa sp.]